MSTTSFLSENRRYKTGWLILFITGVLLIINNLYLVFYESPVWGLGHLGFSLLATLIIYFPYRQGEKWAWYSLWILPVVLLLLAILVFMSGQPMLGWYYAVLTLVVLAGLLLSNQPFVGKS